MPMIFGHLHDIPCPCDIVCYFHSSFVNLMLVCFSMITFVDVLYFGIMRTLNEARLRLFMCPSKVIIALLGMI